MCILSYHQYKYKSSNGLINIDKKQTFTFMTNADINKNRNCFSRSYPPHFHTHRHPFRIYLNNVFVESSRHRLITKYYFNTREKERERDITGISLSDNIVLVSFASVEKFTIKSMLEVAVVMP